MAEHNHDSPSFKIQTPLGIVKMVQRIKTHVSAQVAAPDSTGGHLSFANGQDAIVPSKGTFDDNVPTVNLESEGISPGVGVGGHGRLIKDANSSLTQPVDPFEQYFKPKYASKAFSGKIKF